MEKLGFTFTKFVRTTAGGANISFNARLVFSVLAFRKARSIKSIATLTGMARRSISLGFNELITLGLIDEKQRIADTERFDLFGSKLNDGLKWTDRIATLSLRLPRRGIKLNNRKFTLHHAAVLSLFLSYKRAGKDKRYNYPYVAMCLGFSRDTAKRIIHDLEVAKLIAIDIIKDRFRIIRVIESHDYFLTNPRFLTAIKTIMGTGELTQEQEIGAERIIKINEEYEQQRQSPKLRLVG